MSSNCNLLRCQFQLLGCIPSLLCWRRIFYEVCWRQSRFTCLLVPLKFATPLLKQLQYRYVPTITFNLCVITSEFSMFTSLECRSALFNNHILKFEKQHSVTLTLSARLALTSSHTTFRNSSYLFPHTF